MGKTIEIQFLMNILFIVLFTLSAPVYSSSLQNIRILSAEKRVDLTSPIIRTYLTLKVENIGTSDVKEILLAFPPTEAKHLAILKASSTEGKQKRKKYIPLDVNPTESPHARNGAKLYSVSLSKPLKSSEKEVLEILYVLTHSLEPFPAEISQKDPQLVYYRDSAVLLSPYHVVEQISYIKTPNKKVKSFTRVEPSNSAGAELRYGHYRDQTPYSYSPIIVHFENNNPFAVVEEFVRIIEISHWGSLQITEHYKLVHAGARHKGVFSRLDYQARPSVEGAASFKNLLASLPPRVHSVYYRDDIGNISTSHLRSNSQKSELEIEPRYPLFGGWKSSFLIGYGLPLQDFLFESSNGQRYLNISFGCPLIETIVDELTIKVVLPEGSKNPVLSIPFSADQTHETRYSYLDVIGRPTVVIKKKNVVPEHSIPFQVYYDFSPVFMLAEPLMLVSAFFLFFVACIAYVNIDLSIRKS